MRRLPVALIAALAGAAGCKSKPEAPACTDAVYDVAAFDALLAPVAPFSRSPLYVTDAEALVEAPAFRAWVTELEAAAKAPTDALAPSSAVALQNDVWGLEQRLRPLAGTSSTASVAAVASRALIRRLAPRDTRPLRGAGLPETLPARVAAWPEHESEMPSLQHERAYGMRRLFRVLVDGPRRALVSQLVGLDEAGRPFLSNIIGDVEALGFSGEQVMQAAVWHLDRRALRGCGEVLKPVEVVDHIPAEGANRFIFEPDAPVALAELPCRECHRSLQMMSVADKAGPSDARLARLLKELAEAPELLPAP